MNEDKINDQTELSEEKAPAELPKQEGKAKADELSREEKRLERLSGLKEKYNKAVSAQSAAEKKTKDISAQIAKIEKEIHSEEIAALDKACGAKGISYAEITELIWEIPDNKKLREAVKVLK